MDWLSRSDSSRGAGDGKQRAQPPSGTVGSGIEHPDTGAESPG
jgi:hypothetical protein